MTKNEALNWKDEFTKKLKEERTTYRAMCEFCAEDMILNNEIISKYNEHYCDLEIYCGSDYDEESEEYTEVFQWYIIGSADAERFEEFTNELVYYLPEFDMYVLAVTHWGTAWDGVASNWK